jgi:hypothetical protein
MSLQTPDAIRTLQRKLYGKAKAEPGFRFYILYDKVWRTDILRHAHQLARANDGAPGVDGVTFDQIEADGLENWLTRLAEELRTKTYRCQPVRRVMIPKAGGGERPLGIPTIRDRVVQTAAKLVLEPVFEADLDQAAYGYRPRRGASQAIQAVLTLLRQGYTDVVDADLSKYFDTIPHDELMQSLARRIVDPDMLRLIKLWLKAPVETTDGDGRRHMEGGEGQPTGRAARRRHQSADRQPLHEPLPEILAPDRQGGTLAGSCHQLCGRLRHSQPWLRGRVSGVDGSHDDPPGADPEPDQDPVVRCTNGPVRLSRIQLRTAPHPPGRAPISRRQPIGQERAASEGQAGYHPGPRQQERMAESTRHPDPTVTRVVRILQPWLPLCLGPADRDPPL